MKRIDRDIKKAFEANLEAETPEIENPPSKNPSRGKSKVLIPLLSSLGGLSIAAIVVLAIVPFGGDYSKDETGGEILRYTDFSSFGDYVSQSEDGLENGETFAIFDPLDAFSDHVDVQNYEYDAYRRNKSHPEIDEAYFQIRFSTYEGYSPALTILDATVDFLKVDPEGFSSFSWDGPVYEETKSTHRYLGLDDNGDDSPLFTVTFFVNSNSELEVEPPELWDEPLFLEILDSLASAFNSVF